MPATNPNSNIREEEVISSFDADHKYRSHRSVANILFSHSPFPVLCFDSSLHIVDINPAMENVMGMPKARAAGKLVTDICPFCNTEDTVNIPEQIFYGKTISLAEKKYKLRGNKNDTNIYKVTIEPVFNDAGIISGGMLIASPVYNKLQEDPGINTESILEEAELLAGFGTWEWDTKTNAIKWSTNLYRIYGMEPYEKEINLENFVNSVYPKDLDIVNEFISQIIKEKRSVSYQHRIFRKDGKVRTVSGRSKPFFDEQGNLLKVAGCTVDITDSEEAQRLLEEEKDFSEYIINNSTFGISTFDANLRYTAWNTSMEQLTGVSRKKALGKTVWQLFPSLKNRKNEALFREVLEGKKVLLHERAIEEGTGFFEANMVPLRNKKGEIIGGLILITDITARKLAEIRLKQKNKELEQSNKELERFADVVSHDLKEPLRMISNYTQMFARKYEEMLDKDAKKFIHFALDGVHRIQLVINDLTEYNALGAQNLETANANVAQLLKKVLKELKPVIDSSGAEITYDALPEVISCNKRQFHLLFYNLIENAIKFKRDTAPKIHISAEKKHNEWLFCVKDNGIGIDQKYADRIFIIFQRLHDRDAFEGTGIGLAICRKIIELHKGKIWYKSVPGQGTTFFFTLPHKNQVSG